jgi:hypothetical protein
LWSGIRFGFAKENVGMNDPSRLARPPARTLRRDRLTRRPPLAIAAFPVEATAEQRQERVSPPHPRFGRQKQNCPDSWRSGLHVLCGNELFCKQEDAARVC